MVEILAGLLALTRNQEHGAQSGGSLHQRATRTRDGFMTKKQSRDLARVVEYVNAQSQPFFRLHPSPDSFDFAEGLSSSRVILDPDMQDGPIDRASDLIGFPALHSTTARPGWLVVQTPRDGVQRFPLQITLPATTGKKTWIIPFFADLPQNEPGLPNIYGAMTFGIGQTAGSTIDGNNIVYCQISQWGGHGAQPANTWAIDFAAVQGGVPVYGAPTKLISGAPPVAVVFVKHEDEWHMEVLLAGNHPAHVSGEFTCDITPDRFASAVLTDPLTSHRLVRGYQGLYAFDTDELVL